MIIYATLISDTPESITSVIDSIGNGAMTIVQPGQSKEINNRYISLIVIVDPDGGEPSHQYTSLLNTSRTRNDVDIHALCVDQFHRVIDQPQFTIGAPRTYMNVETLISLNEDYMPNGFYDERNGTLQGSATATLDAQDIIEKIESDQDVDSDHIVVTLTNLCSRIETLNNMLNETRLGTA